MSTPQDHLDPAADVRSSRRFQIVAFPRYRSWYWTGAVIVEVNHVAGTVVGLVGVQLGGFEQQVEGVLPEFGLRWLLDETEAHIARSPINSRRRGSLGRMTASSSF